MTEPFITETNPEFTATACELLARKATEHFHAIGGDALVAEWVAMPLYNLSVSQGSNGYVVRAVFQRALTNGGTERHAFSAVYDTQQRLVACAPDALPTVQHGQRAR